MKINVKKLHPDAVIPTKATVGSAGFDLYALNDCIIFPGKKVVLGTGLSFDIPKTHFMSILGRSGLAFKNSIVACHTGTIDSDFRGEVKLLLFNMFSEFYEIKKGDRIAQAVILPVPDVELIEVEELSETDRGTGGYGSTGK